MIVEEFFSNGIRSLILTSFLQTNTSSLNLERLRIEAIGRYSDLLGVRRMLCHHGAPKQARYEI